MRYTLQRAVGWDNARAALDLDRVDFEGRVDVAAAAMYKLNADSFIAPRAVDLQPRAATNQQGIKYPCSMGTSPLYSRDCIPCNHHSRGPWIRRRLAHY